MDRITALEKAALGAEALTGSIDQRIDELEKVVSPNQANWKGSGGNSLGVVSSVGKGLKNATKSAVQSTAEPAKSVLKSPTFWMLLITNRSLFRDPQFKRRRCCSCVLLPGSDLWLPRSSSMPCLHGLLAMHSLQLRSLAVPPSKKQVMLQRD